MGRSKHRNRKIPQSRSTRRDNGFTIARHPFSDVEPKVVQAALLQLAEKKIEQFPDLLAQALNCLRKCNPIHTLSILSSYGLQIGASEEGVSDQSMMPALQQYHVELLQALAMTLPLSQWGAEPPRPPEIQEISDALAELGDSFHQRRYKAIEGERDEQARVVLALQERLRVHTQIVRNWGYFSDVVKISTDLYAPLDADFQKCFFFKATELIAVAKCMTDIIERRSTKRFQRLKRVFREHEIKRMIRAYYKEFVPEGDVEEFINQYATTTSYDAMKGLLLSHADLNLPDVFTFEPKEISDETGIEVNAVVLVLRSLSIDPGELANENREHIFLNNPVWRRPVMDMREKFLCVMPQAILSHIHDIMRAHVEKCDPKPELEQVRAEFLERSVARLLDITFPNAKKWHAVKWKVDNTTYETDHILALDRTIIIVEDKSASLTAPALRGAPDRVRRHVRELIAEPSEQSARLEQIIWSAKAGSEQAITCLSGFGHDFSATEQVVRLSVTLDHLSTLATEEEFLRKAGWIDPTLVLAPTVNLADLQCVVDILERPSLFVHYFLERARLQKSLHIVADELDFLGFYLMSGFNFWSFEQEKPNLTLTGMSKAVDRYYSSRDAGISIPKPKPKLTEYFAALIRAIESRGFSSWLTVTTELLRSASYDEQLELDRRLNKLRRNVQKNWRDPDHECCLVFSPPEIRESVIVYYAYPRQLERHRRETVRDLAEKAMEMSRRSRCILISRSLERWTDPYASVFIARAT